MSLDLAGPTQRCHHMTPACNAIAKLHTRLTQRLSQKSASLFPSTHGTAFGASDGHGLTRGENHERDKKHDARLGHKVEPANGGIRTQPMRAVRGLDGTSIAVAKSACGANVLNEQRRLWDW